MKSPGWAAELLSCWCPPINPALPGWGGCAQASSGGWGALLAMPARISAGAARGSQAGPCWPRLWSSPSPGRCAGQSRVWGGAVRSCEGMSLWDRAGDTWRDLAHGSGAGQWLVGNDPTVPREGKSYEFTLAGPQSVPVQSGEQLRAQLLILSM